MPPTYDKTGRTRTLSGSVLAAPPRSTTRAYRRNKIAGPFVGHLIQMLEAPAFRVLSLSAHRLLSRVEIEHAHHGGRDNGKLPVTYDDFENYGIDRHAIAPATREVVALGFLQVTEQGRAANAEYRTPNKFQLTYLATGSAGATDEWKRIETIEQAKAIALAARKPIRRERPTNGAARKQNPVGANTRFSEENPHRKARVPNGGNHHYSQGRETPTTFYILGRGDK